MEINRAYLTFEHRIAEISWSVKIYYILQQKVFVLIISERIQRHEGDIKQNKWLHLNGFCRS